MAHPLKTILIVADTKSIESTFRGGLEVVVGVNARDVCQRQNALFRKQVIQLELAQLEVEPGAPCDVIDASPDRLKVEITAVVGGWQNVKAVILGQGSTGME